MNPRLNFHFPFSTFDFRFSSFAVLLACTISCHQADQSSEATQYTCPMHPTVISDKQGTCPVCGMDLVRKARAGEKEAAFRVVSLML